MKIAIARTVFVCVSVIALTLMSAEYSNAELNLENAVGISVDHKQSETPAMRTFFTFPPTRSTEGHQ